MILEVFDDPAAVGRAAAEHFVSVKPKSVVLSGGSTPRVLYELLADPSEPFREQIAWDETHFFFSDERHVPPDHAESNYRMVNEALFSRVALPKDNVHRVPAENRAADDAASAYEADLRRFFGEAMPAFDLILLGLGEDGHTASLFPHSAALKENQRLVVAPYVEKLGVYRITLTLPVLNNGKSVVFLVTGASKATALRKIIYADKKTDKKPERDAYPAQAISDRDFYPAQAISPTNGAVSWFVDKAAARLCSHNNSSNAADDNDLLNKNP